ncbi:uncharacterized protein LOC116207868 [Punica granatum]|uniref:Senescence regulator S40 n=2 Tax=Punica granatum TaxID=22663 RepID=A0A218XCG7_PUNGR|nr:uncharacterized protein LOC116207868 [Punica granatum]OWM82406.1 hypothetical protein CDL15_Pgr001980 [Punica granatum]PKI65160.1 hypothetical protein CRG98_014474 [Punica granatum]
MAASKKNPRTKPIPIGSAAPPPNDLSDPHEVGSPPENIFEFDDSEDWTNPSYEAVVPLPNLRKTASLPKKLRPRKLTNNAVRATSRSLPMNIPGRHDHCHHWRGTGDEESEGADCRLPPHEYLARKWGTSHSMLEGIGRTLKGRDLQRVRNAVWKKIGFEG